MLALIPCTCRLLGGKSIDELQSRAIVDGAETGAEEERFAKSGLCQWPGMQKIVGAVSMSEEERFAESGSCQCGGKRASEVGCVRKQAWST